MTIDVTTLPSGLRVVSQSMPHLETVSLGIWVGAGARHENEDEHGISHLLEHMAFKGTPQRSARQIAEEIEAVGGDLNAATSLEGTSYYARILKNDVRLALDLLSDILQNPTFDEVELRREQDVILQEIAAVQDSPDDIIYDLAQETAFPDQALGRPILGTMESVLHLSPDNLRSYMERHYKSGSMVLGAAGAVEHAVLVEEATRLFSAKQPARSDQTNPADYKGGTKISNRSFEQSHIILSFEGVSYRHEDYYASQVFSGLFGGGMSSRLFQEVREKRGLCYSIYSFSWGLSDTGLFGVHAATGAEHVKELVKVITDLLKQAAVETPTEVELSRAKAQLKAGLLMSLESSSARAEQLARQMLGFGRPLEIEELIQKVDKVRGEDVRQFAENLLTRSKPCCVGVGLNGTASPALERIEQQLQ